MANFFFDILPEEIRQEIYGIRLSNMLANIYYKRVAMKTSFAYLILKLKYNLNETTNYYPHRGIYYNPKEHHVRYIMEKCNKIISNSDDKIWWISQLIRPVELGLIIYANNYVHNDENYLRTEQACNNLIEKLHCRKSPFRN